MTWLVSIAERFRLWATSGVGFAWIGAWTLLALVVLLNSAGIFVIDIKPEIYFAPWRTAELFAAPWQVSPQLGWASFNVGLAPVPAAVAALHLLGVDAELSSRVVRLLLLTVAAAGAARLVRVVGPGRGRPWIGFLAGVLIVANPYTVVGGSTLAILLPLALLPWLLIALVKSVWHGGWRWPAAAALCFAAMSGMNAGVIPLLQLVAVPWVAWWAASECGIGFGRTVAALARSAVLVFLVSLYWIVPTLSGVAFGVSVVQNSETLEGINAVSSLAEVLRGLGMWTMYGTGGDGPWQPGFASYLIAPLVIVTSFALLVATLWCLARVPLRITRPFGGMALTAAVLMVGLYPLETLSPAGTALRWLFTEVPITGAFRTTNKLGAVLVVAVVVIVCAGVTSLHPRAWSLPARSLALAAVIGVLVGSVWPAFSGGLYPRAFPIPDYWKQAASEIDQQNAYSRVWLIPGEVQADYTWATSQPDDLALPLFSRRSLLRTVLPIASPSGANLLYGLDSRLQAGELLPGTLSTFARSLSVGDLVVRNDTRWQPVLGARPWTVRDQLVGDGGLSAPRGWGLPGQNIVPTADLAGLGEATLTPVQAYGVPLAAPIVRAQSLRGALLVSGDAASMTTVVEAGLMPADQTFLYLPDLTQTQFADLLGPLRRIVLTDGNRRVDVAPGRLTFATSPLLPEAVTPASTRALGSADDQTVLVVEGGAARASVVGGGSASPAPGGAAEFAFDGDPGSSWQFGGFGAGVGATITAEFPEARDVGTIVFNQAVLGPVSIDTVTVTAGDRVVTAPVAREGRTAIAVDASEVSSLTVRVDALAGEGINGLAVTDIEIPGFQLTRIARLPTTLDRQAMELPPLSRLALAQTPLDVVLRRENGGAAFPSPEERTLLRNFSMPNERTFRAYGLVRIGAVAERGVDGCLTVATINGAPLRMRTLGTVEAGQSALMESCAPITLSAGDQKLRPVPWVLIDRLTLRDSLGESVVAPGPVPWVTFTESAGPRYDVSVAATLEPVMLVAADAADARWTWSGAALSPRPTVVNGGLNGWFLPAGPATDGVIAFGPQRRDQVAAGVSAITAGACLLLALPLLWRRRSPPARAPLNPLRSPRIADVVAPAVVMWLLLGPWSAGAVVIAGGVWWFTRRWQPLASASVVLGALVPVAWLAGNADRLGQVSGLLVMSNPWPHTLACITLGVAVMVQVARGRGGTSEGEGVR